MTEPVARRSPARRTVRVAAALVAGQVALCAVIGWVTFGPSPEKPTARTAGTLAERPIVPTTMALPGARKPATSATTTSITTTTRPSKSARPATQPPAPPPDEAGPPPLPPAPLPPEGTPTTVVSESPIGPPSPNPELNSDSPQPAPSTSDPVVVDGVCTEPDATGTTPEGVTVRCLPDADGVLHWKIS